MPSGGSPARLPRDAGGARAAKRATEDDTVLTFYFTTVTSDRWAWKVQDRHGRLVACSLRGFHYYLDALADARQSGHRGPPSFAPADASTVTVPRPGSRSH